MDDIQILYTYLTEWCEVLMLIYDLLLYKLREFDLLQCKEANRVADRDNKVVTGDIGEVESIVN
jgi:hypothetical protein